MSVYPLPIAAPLIEWYQHAARKLPWRETRDAYHIWVSEVMLQQTRVEAVLPYYARFIAALPTIATLAEANEDRLLKLWEGLGYYSRARNMRRAARVVRQSHGGVLPQDVKALLRLPGIGPYTAGAIASIAYNIPAPAVDGNVLRVLARLCNSTLDITLPATRQLARAAIAAMLPAGAPGTFNQAMMELGACVCLPNTPPLCGVCPLCAFCAGHRGSAAASLPVKSKKAPRRQEDLTVFAIRRCGRVAVRKRDSSGLLAGMYELPNAPGHLNEAAMLAQLAAWGVTIAGAFTRHTAKHIFTHVEWHMRVYTLHAGGAHMTDRARPADNVLPAGWAWADEASGHALPSAFKKCL
ncbi:MAG: A/G-specific adenine glycosylase [Clostridiales bacterium]|jgi:A/G-specific adenine glycosylase|nr:A/G-specific adenine glycosylase [Clostridiales bacterium]